MADHASNPTGQSQSELVAGDTYTFGVQGGRYAAVRTASNWDSDDIVLNILGADGETWIPFATWTENGASEVFLPPGQVRISCGSDVVDGGLRLIRMG